MDPKDLRDPEAERRTRRLAVVALVVLVALALAAASFAAFANRPSDHHYRYSMTYTNTNGATFILRVPLPSDPELQGRWTTLGNATASVEESPYGKVLRLAGWGNISVAAYLDTWRDVPLTLTTEGMNNEAHPAARVFLNTTGISQGSILQLSIREIDPAWTTDRHVDGSLFEGWNTMAFRETLTTTQSAGQ